MTKKFWVGFITVGLAGSMFFTGAVVLKRRRIESDLARLAVQRAEQQRAILRAREALAEDDRAATAQQREQQEFEAVRKAALGAVHPEARQLDDGLILAQHHELRAKFERAGRNDLDDSYGALFRQWKLSPEKIEKLTGLMIRDAENALDLRGAAGAHGVDIYGPGAVTMRERQFAELLAAEQALLAPEEYQALQRLQRINAVRSGVDELSAAALFSAPFTATQIEQLTQTLAEASRTYQSGGAASWDAIDWDRALARAASFLSEPQLAGVRGYVDFYGLAAQHLPQVLKRDGATK